METSNDMTTKFDETIDKIKEIEAKYNNLVISKQELMEKIDVVRTGFIKNRKLLTLLKTTKEFCFFNNVIPFSGVGCYREAKRI